MAAAEYDKINLWSVQIGTVHGLANPWLNTPNPHIQCTVHAAVGGIQRFLRPPCQTRLEPIRELPQACK